MKHPLVENLENRLLAEFEEIAEKIRQVIPHIIVTVCSMPCGSLTEYQGYDFHIDCVLTDITLTVNSHNSLDNIALTVGLGHLTTIPKIHAYVGWGKAEFKDHSGVFPKDGLIVTDELLEELYQDLPRLYEALFEALQRRKPNNM